MIDSLRQHYFPRGETTNRDRKISGSHTKGLACLMGETNSLSLLIIYAPHVICFDWQSELKNKTCVGHHHV